MADSTAGTGRKPQMLTGAFVTAWAWDQDVSVPEKLLLLAIADQSGRDGAWIFGAQKELATLTGMGVRTVRRHLAVLEERGLIRRCAQYELGSRLADRIELAVTADSVPANLAATLSPANGQSIPAKSATGQSGRTLHSSSTSKPIDSSLEVKEEVPGQSGRNAELTGEMRADVDELLRRRHKVNGQVVSEGEMLIAAAALDEFNRQIGSDFGLGANLRSITMRIRERPSWDAAKHVRLVQSACRLRWWEHKGGRRRATPAVIYGERAFENVVQDARDEQQAREVQAADHGLIDKTWPDGRSWQELTNPEQENAKQAVLMGIRPWEPREAPAPLNGNGNGKVVRTFNSRTLLDAD